MKKLIICAAIIFAAIGTLSAQETKSREVEVFTRVERNITPDEILISITINEQDNKGKVSLQKQEEAMIKTLKGIGIDVEEALKVNDIASSLKTYILKKDDIFLSKEYTLKVKTAAQAVNAITSLNNIAIADVEISQIKVSDQLENQIKKELLAEASVACKENAKSMVEAVESTLGNVVYMHSSISQNYTGARYQVKSSNGVMLMDSSGGYQQVPQLEIQEVPVSVSVTCRFEIK